MKSVSYTHCLPNDNIAVLAGFVQCTVEAILTSVCFMLIHFCRGVAPHVPKISPAAHVKDELVGHFLKFSGHVITSFPASVVVRVCLRIFSSGLSHARIAETREREKCFI